MKTRHQPRQSTNALRRVPVDTLQQVDTAVKNEYKRKGQGGHREARKNSKIDVTGRPSQDIYRQRGKLPTAVQHSLYFFSAVRRKARQRHTQFPGRSRQNQKGSRGSAAAEPGSLWVNVKFRPLFCFGLLPEKPRFGQMHGQFGHSVRQLASEQVPTVCPSDRSEPRKSATAGFLRR